MKLKTVLSVVAFASLATAANAKEVDITKDWPELNDQAPSAVSTLASTTMKCFVDTPAYDHYRINVCFAAGHSRTTTAVFAIDGGPSTNYKVYWSDSRCSQSSKTCMLPIRWYETITLSADVLDLSSGTFSSSSASATYEGYF